MKTVLMAELPRRHSEKPAAMVDFIEGISPAPRLELFSRRKRMGWDVWGNEVENSVELFSLTGEGSLTYYCPVDCKLNAQKQGGCPYLFPPPYLDRGEHYTLCPKYRRS